MRVMCVTGDSTRSEEEFDRFLTGLAASPPDYFQVRDKTASDRRLTGLLRRAVEALGRSRVLANARFDLALASGAAGVVLPEAGLPIPDVRRETPRGFLIGKSCHSAAAAKIANQESADLVLLGPIFETPSKAKYGPPLSPAALDEIPAQTPEGPELLLIGGIGLASLPRLAPCRDRFAGIAAIRTFESAGDPSAVVSAFQRA